MAVFGGVAVRLVLLCFSVAVAVVQEGHVALCVTAIMSQYASLRFGSGHYGSVRFTKRSLRPWCLMDRLRFLLRRRK